MSYLDKTAGIPGIYCITNHLDGRKYVGQSSDCGRRWRIHLNSNTLPVQKDINTLGRENFTFQILEEVPDADKRLEREKYWIQKLGSFEHGYNSSKGGERGWVKGRPKSEETRKKMSQSQKGKPKSEETKRRMSLAKKGIVVSPETRRKISEAKMGVPLSEETRRKMSLARRGVPKTKHQYLLPDGTIKVMAATTASRHYLKKGIVISKIA